jgi:ABC-type sugar transport system ATPase subunit
MHILAGVHQPDAGRIDFDGEIGVEFPGERASQERGIALVHQERSLFGAMTVAENIFAGREPVTAWGRIDRRRLRGEARILLRQVGLETNPDTPVDCLSPAHQQLVEVAKALSLRSKLIVFDEPTAALASAEVATLFALIRRLRDQGVGLIYISHRLEEVFALADRATVLKDGIGQGTSTIAELTPHDLVRRMVGRDLCLHQARDSRRLTNGRVVLEVRGVGDAPDQPGLSPGLKDISFQVRAGEIIALAGLVGAGRTELALALFGCRPNVVGEVLIDGRPARLRSPIEAIKAGIGYLPEDRKDDGLFAEMSIADNIAAVAARRFGTWRHRASAARSVALQLCDSLRVACRGPHEPVNILSGGNQQKVVLARWLLAGPRVLIVDEPTRGVDVGAKVEIHNLLFQLAFRGTAVIVISSDLPEVLAVADRVLVMREGRLAGELPRGQATEAAVLELASMSALRSVS